MCDHACVILMTANRRQCDFVCKATAPHRIASHRASRIATVAGRRSRRRRCRRRLASANLCAYAFCARVLRGGAAVRLRVAEWPMTAAVAGSQGHALRGEMVSDCKFIMSHTLC